MTNEDKGLFHPRKKKKKKKGEERYSSTISLIEALDGAGAMVVNAMPRLLYLRERPGTHCTRDADKSLARPTSQCRRTDPIVSLEANQLLRLNNTGRFMMFSVITNIYNKKPKGPTLMELFTATGKLRKSFLTTRDVRCVHHG
jgi:hypothetical protein